MILHHRLTELITLQNFPLRFRAGCGTGTATTEAKLIQQITAFREEVLYVIFLDLQKVYDALDRSRCLDILEGYGMVPQVCRLLRTYWRRLTMVERSGRYYGAGFKGDRGVRRRRPKRST